MKPEIVADLNFRPEGIDTATPVITPVVFDVLTFVEPDMAAPMTRHAKKVAGPNQVGQIWIDLQTEGMPFAGYYEGSGLPPQEVAHQIDAHGEYLLHNLTPSSAESTHILQVVAGEIAPNEYDILRLLALQRANLERYRAIRARFPRSVGFREQLNQQVCLPGSFDYRRNANGELVQEVRFAPKSKSLSLSDATRSAAEIVLSRASEASTLQKDLVDAGGDPLFRAFAESLMDPYSILQYAKDVNGKQTTIIREGNAAYRDYLRELKRYRNILVPQIRY